METKETQNKMLKELAGLDSLLISYSGGVDSTLLAVFAQRALRDRVKCILFDAPVVPRRAVDVVLFLEQTVSFMSCITNSIWGRNHSRETADGRKSRKHTA